MTAELARAVPLTDWTLEASGPSAPQHLRHPFPVTVPGSVHGALIDRGEIDDLTRQGREVDQEWVSRTAWCYRMTLRRPQGSFDRASLVFRGIDTVATITVGGRERLRTENMFRTYRVDVTDDLTDHAQVEVAVQLEPALDLAEARELVNPLPRPPEYTRPYNQVRKMACSFGWDWGPATVTCGLWGQVELQTWRGAAVAALDVQPTVGDHPRVDVSVTIEGKAAAVEISVVRVEDSAVLATRRLDVVDGVLAHAAGIDVPEAEQWWPRGHGRRPLYDVVVGLVDDAGNRLDEASRRVGFRTVDLVQEPDDGGRSFELWVNGRPVWIRGVNWIPDDILPERVTEERYRQRLTQAADAGANFVRVWGGGIYETDTFYDVCDELGLLVQQDFLFACAAYPEDDATQAEVVAEASEAIERLRHRASLVMWCGNNENLWGHADWGWSEQLAGRGWGDRYYRAVLSDLVVELDGHRPYVPGSPFSPDGRHPNALESGIAHLWDVWNRLDYQHYEDYEPRFVAEFGYQGPASLPTLVEAVGDSAVEPMHPKLALHQKAADGRVKLQKGLDRHFPEPPESGVPWYLAAALTQARAVAVGVRHLRSLDRCSGAVYWQLNDCWPAISWSIVDSRGRRKLSWHALRDAFADRLLVLARGDAGLRLVAVNDADDPWQTVAVVRTFVTAAGEPTTQHEHLDIAPRSRAVIDLRPPADAELVVVDADGQRVSRWLVDDRRLRLPRHDVEVRHEQWIDGVRVTVRARTLIRDAWLATELAVPDALVEPQLVTLCAGESVTFDVALPPGLDTERIEWADLVWSDNRLRDLARPVG